MRSWRWFVLSSLVLPFLGSRAWASDPVGIYALVDKVVLEPNDDNPDRIQVWGAFSVAKPWGSFPVDKRTPRRELYEAPARGYLYFTRPSEKHSREAFLAQWADLKKVAGTGQAVGFGVRYQASDKKLRLRKAGEKPENPDEYPMGFGLTKLRKDTPYRPVADLFMLPGPASPVDGGTIECGKVTLVARNILERDRKDRRQTLRYRFEIEKASGEKEASPPIEPGEKETRWTPKMEVKPGEKCTWRVWVSEDVMEGPAASAIFTGKGSAKEGKT